MRWTGGVVVALLAVLLAAGSADAATWSAPVAISAPGGENTEADIAIAPDGTAIAVWRRADCRRTEAGHNCENERIQYSVRPPGGSFSPPVEIPGDPGTEAAAPRLAVDAAGNAIATWVSVTAVSRVRYSLRPAGGDFEAAKTIPDGVASAHSFPELAMAPDGRAVATFLRLVAGATEVSYAIRPPGGDFGPAASVPGDLDLSQTAIPRVELDDTGAGIAYWDNEPVGGPVIRFAQLAAGSAEFAPTETLAPGISASLAMAPSGAAVFAWTDEQEEEVLYAFRAAGGAFGPPLSIPQSASVLPPIAAIDAAGRAVVGWSAAIATDTFVRWAASPPGGPFGAPQPMPPDSRGTLNDLELSDQGAALALWVGNSGPVKQVHASVRPPGGSFGDPTVLAGPPQGVAPFGAVAAFGPSGNAAALWSGEEPTSQGSHDVPLLASVLDLDRGPPTTTPRIEGLRVQPKRFLAGAKPTAKATASARTGTTVRFRLSESATVRLRVERRKPGVRVRAKGKLRCLPPTPPNLARGTGKRCPIFKRAGALVRNTLPGGPNQIKFSGRIGRKALEPGRYRFVTTAVNKAGVRSQPRRAAFQVLSP